VYAVALVCSSSVAEGTGLSGCYAVSWYVEPPGSHPKARGALDLKPGACTLLNCHQPSGLLRRQLLWGIMRIHATRTTIIDNRNNVL
jgi:hypothetical protein